MFKVDIVVDFKPKSRKWENWPYFESPAPLNFSERWASKFTEIWEISTGT